MRLLGLFRGAGVGHEVFHYSVDEAHLEQRTLEVGVTVEGFDGPLGGELMALFLAIPSG